MGKMLPWVRAYWSTLSDSEKEEIVSLSQAICDAVTLDGTRSGCKTAVAQLCKKYPWFNTDCKDTLDTVKYGEDVYITERSADFLMNYFSQFGAQLAGERVKQSQNQIRTFRLQNDFYGEIIGHLLYETEASYVFRCFLKNKVVMDRWRLDKNSFRILEEIF